MSTAAKITIMNLMKKFIISGFISSENLKKLNIYNSIK